MASITIINPTKMKDLEKLITEVSPGDVVKIYTGYAPSMVFRGDSERHQTMIGESNLPDSKPLAYFEEEYHKQKAWYCSDVAPAVLGILHHFFVGEKGFVIRPDGAQYQTKTTLWAILTNAVSAVCEPGSSVDERTPCTSIDVYCIHAYERVGQGYGFPLTEDERRRVYASYQHPTETFESKRTPQETVSCLPKMILESKKRARDRIEQSRKTMTCP